MVRNQVLSPLPAARTPGGPSRIPQHKQGKPPRALTGRTLRVSHHLRLLHPMHRPQVGNRREQNAS